MLRAQNFFSSKLFDLVRQMILLIDRKGNILNINKKGYELLGYPKKHLIGKNWFDHFIIKENSPRLKKNFIYAVQSGKIDETCEHKVLCGKGKVKKIIWNNSLLFDEHGKKILGILCSGVDLTAEQEYENKLRESEHKYRTLIENIYQVVFNVDFTGELTKLYPAFVSDRIKDITGFTAKEFRTGKVIFQERLHPKDNEAAAASFFKMMKIKKRITRTYRFKTKKGDYKWFQDTLIPKVNENGEVWGCFGVLEEITEKKVNQAILKDYEKFFSLSHDMFCMAGSDSYFKKVNPSFMRVLGYTEKELLERPFTEFVHPEDFVKTKNEVVRLNSGITTIDFENRYRNKDGSYTWMAWTSTPSNRYGIIYAAARDITAQKNAEERLRENEQRLSEAQKIAKVGAWEYDAGTGKIHWTEETYKMFGLKPGSKPVSQEQFRKLIHQDDREQFTDLVNKALQKKEPYETEVRVNWTDGSQHYLLIRGKPFIREGKVYKIIGTSIDITARKQAERRELKALVNGQDMERKRIADDLHDSLGQKLSAIKLQVENLDCDNIREAKYKMKKVENELKETIEELRNISLNLLPPMLSDFGLSNALKFLCDNLNKHNGPKIIFQTFGLKKSLNENLEFNIYRMAQELLHNALKHSKASEVSFQIFKREKKLILTVEDDGIGFNPNRINSKSGIGLKSVTSRIKALNGIFHLDTNPQKGTVISIEIPLTP